MPIVTATVKRKGKVVGRSRIAAEHGKPFEDAIRAAGEEARRQAKAADVATHTGRKAYRKKSKTDD
jgi:hypothetical protein